MTGKRKQQPFEKQALDLFRQAKIFLLANNCFAPTVFLVYPGRVAVFELSFQDAQEKYSSFATVVSRAIHTNAAAIISITDQRYRKLSHGRTVEEFAKTYQQGDLSTDNAPEALGMIVSPRDAPDWGLAVPYKRTSDATGIVYGKARYNKGKPYKNNLIPEIWKRMAKTEAASHNKPLPVRK
jgi:hypothetical protein